MDKINHTTKDILGGNIEKIAQLFPSVVTEAHDEATGELKRVVDFDLLRQHLSDTLVEGDRERFRLDWPGKKASILKANTPISKTLRPVREDSVDFDTTGNVFIEGDNFEVLKVLQESYLGKIKMIYIDPPYNTGKDFIYRDNFTQDREDYEEEIGVRDDENGGKLVKNTETNGRYHSDWLSMMQERLIVARDLLTDDGVIFISIDDNEQANLKNLCDEIYGENSYIATIPRLTSAQRPSQESYVSITHDYVLVYARSKDYDFNHVIERDLSKMREDNNGSYIEGDTSPILASSTQGYSAGGDYDVEFNGKVYAPVDQNGNRRRWLWTKDRMNKAISLGIVVETKSTLRVKNYINKEFQVGTNKLISKDPKLILTTNDLVTAKYANNGGTAELRTLEADKYFDFPKPVRLVGILVSLATDKDSTVLDFFSGSGTTAHAVMQLNAEDGGNRKHIQVQLAEPTDEKSEAYKAGYKSIPEISRERIRRAGKKIREDYAEQIAKRDTPLDTGFRAYRLSSSNFINTAQHPNETTQASLLETANNIKEDRTAEDLLTETILDLGLTLDLPIETRNIAGHNVYFVSGNSLAACFDDNVTLDIVEPLATEKPLRVVFKDSSFASDEVRVNIDIRLKQLSPETEIKVL